MIEFDRVSKTFPGSTTQALADVSLCVPDHETLVLLGSSGSGKTTLLKMINRLVQPTGGRVLLEGIPIEQYELLQLRRSIGYVFQGIGLFPHMSVEENVGIVLRLLGWQRRRRRSRAHQLLEVVGLDPAIHAGRLPAQLSGGQQQRVGVARALAADPRYLLMDEPFGALDALSRNALQQQVLQLKAEFAKTVVFVTHDVSEAFLLADKIAVIHEGRLEQMGTPEEIREQPATPFVAELLSTARNSSMHLMDAGS